MFEKEKSTPAQQEQTEQGLPVSIWFIAFLAIAMLAMIFGPSLMAGMNESNVVDDITNPGADGTDTGANVVLKEETATPTGEDADSNLMTQSTVATELGLTETIGPEKLPEYGAMENTYTKVSHKTTFTLEKSGIKGFVSTNSELSKIKASYINPSGMKESVILVQLLNKNGDIIFSKQDPITGEKFSYRKWYPDEYGSFREESTIKNTDDLSKITHWRILIYE